MGLGDLPWYLLYLPFPSGYAKVLLLVPALPLPLHAKLIGEAYDAKHTIPSSLRPRRLTALTPSSTHPLPPLLSLSLSSLSCRCRCHHHHHRPALLSVIRVLFASHTLVSARRHSPTTHQSRTHPPTPPRRSGLSVPPLPWTTDKQADGRTQKPASSKRKQQQVSKSTGQRDAATRILLHPLQHHPAVGTCYTLRYPQQLASSAIPAPRLSLAHRAAAAS